MLLARIYFHCKGNEDNLKFLISTQYVSLCKTKLVLHKCKKISRVHMRVSQKGKK